MQIELLLSEKHMPLPRQFQFSATSLQDYVDCPRRFQLRYLLQVAWPAPQAEPIAEHERYRRLARDFHRLVHQHLLGLPAGTLSASIHDPDLIRWWQSYLAYVPTLGDAQVIPELSLSVPLAGYRVTAQYDAIVAGYQWPVEEQGVPKKKDQSSFLIIDWKTYRRQPSRTWLAGRLQTRVYPVVLVQAGGPALNLTSFQGTAIQIEPEDVEMSYWLAEYPQTPESFSYNSVAYQTDLDFIVGLISEIEARMGGSESAGKPSRVAVRDETWSLTDDMRHCRFNYRSLCDRGDFAGPMAEYVEPDYGDLLAPDETDFGLDLDWGQVQEIVY
jgi:hypothetical protein